jgi:serine-type D-Ala-D-Ala carboxypeptidase (penicillin-binding protein 5/6)
VTGAPGIRDRFTRATVAVATALAAWGAMAGAAAASTPPNLTATAAVVIDARTGDVIYGLHPNSRRSIASTTKLMTAHLTLERASQSDVFTAPAYNPAPAESVIGLRKGERMTVHDLLRALLLPSANDAAWDLASNISGSVPAFVREMNREARKLGLGHTHYANPIGLDDPRNKSTARDLAKLAMLDMRNPAFASIVDLEHATLKSGAHTRVVTNRNDLVAGYRFVDGVKTGHTQQAGYVLVGAAHGRGARVISVVLGTPSEAARDADSLALLRYGLAQYKRVAVFKGAVGTANVPIDWRGGKAKLVPSRQVSLTVRRDTPIAVHVLRPVKVKGPLDARRRVGKVDVLVGGKVVRSVPLVTADKVEGPSLIRKLAAALKVGLIVAGVLLLLVAATLVALRMRVVRRQRAKSAR